MSVRRISCLAVVIVLVAASCSDVSSSHANGLSSDGVVGSEQPPVVQGNSPGTLSEDGSDRGPLDVAASVMEMTDISASQHRLGIQLELREGASECSISGSPDVELIGSFPGDRNSEGGSCALVRTPEPVLPPNWATERSPTPFSRFLTTQAGSYPTTSESTYLVPGTARLADGNSCCAATPQPTPVRTSVRSSQVPFPTIEPLAVVPRSTVNALADALRAGFKSQGAYSRNTPVLATILPGAGVSS